MPLYSSLLYTFTRYAHFSFFDLFLVFFPGTQMRVFFFNLNPDNMHIAMKYNLLCASVLLCSSSSNPVFISIAFPFLSPQSFAENTTRFFYLLLWNSTFILFYLGNNIKYHLLLSYYSLCYLQLYYTYIYIILYSITRVTSAQLLRVLKKPTKHFKKCLCYSVFFW